MVLPLRLTNIRLIEGHKLNRVGILVGREDVPGRLISSINERGRKVC